MPITRICAQQGCFARVTYGRCPDHQRATKPAYSSYAWKKARAEARRRDNNECRRCGSTRNVAVHHIRPLSDGGSLTDLQNLICLCRKCHAAEDALYWRLRADEHQTKGNPYHEISSALEAGLQASWCAQQAIKDENEPEPIQPSFL
jgi:5-methylcytosine-specific restriction endonuclease McrA